MINDTTNKPGDIVLQPKNSRFTCSSLVALVLSEDEDGKAPELNRRGITPDAIAKFIGA